MTIAADILQIACPLCTRMMKDHPGMIADVIVIPVAFVSRHTGQAYLTGVCEHARSIRGPYGEDGDTPKTKMERAESAWRSKVEHLQVEKTKKREVLEKTLQRIHAKSETVLDRDAAAADGVGEETIEASRHEHQQLPDVHVDDREAEYADAHGGPGEASVSAGMCQVSNQIYQRHDFRVNNVCKRCGYKMTTL